MRLLRPLGILAALLLTPAALAQTTVTGRVLDERLDDPLPGATILLGETGLGTSTGLDGTFRAVTPAASGTVELTVSFLGFRSIKRTVTLTGGTVDAGTFALVEDALRTDEIVVTGSGVPTERRQLGNTIASISARDLQDASPLSVDQALAGKIAGAVVTQNSGDPAGGISIRLRGSGTVLGSGDPLYIIDGVIVDNSSAQLIDLGGNAQNRLVDLNPADIERIEVVRGAAAAALYGSRANNGVVQIFTKRGRTGEPRVTLQTSFSTNGVRRTLATNEAAFLRPVNPADPNAAREAVERFDFQDDIFRQAAGTEQYVSVSGGSAGTTYFLSGGHLVNQGVVNGSLFRRFNGRVRLGQDLSSTLKISAGGAFSSSRSDDIPNGGISAAYGALTGFIFGPNTTDPAPDPETGVYPVIGARSNPRDVIDNFDFSQLTNRFTGNVQGDWAPLQGFSVNGLFGLDTYNQRGLALIPRVNTFTSEATGFNRRADLNRTLLNAGLTARYNRDLADGVESTTLVGFDTQNERSTTFAVSTRDLTLGVETLPSGNDPSAPGEFRSESNIFGTFVQETLGIQDQLFLTGAVRLDGSSVFGEDNRWNAYPKVSGSYDVPGLGGALSTARFRTSVGQTGGLTAISPYERFLSLGLRPYVGGTGFSPPFGRGNPDIAPERQTEFEAGVDLGLFGGRLGVELTGYIQNTDDLLLNTAIAPTTGFDSQLANVGTLKNRGVELLLRALPVSTPGVQWNSTVTFALNRNEVDLNPNLDQDPDATLVLGGFNLVAQLDDQPLGTFYTTPYRRDEAGQILGIVYDAAACSATGAPSCYATDASGEAILAAGELDENRILRDANGNALYPIKGEGPAIIGDPNPDWTGSWINEVEIGQRFSFRAQLDASVGGDVFNFTRRLGSLFAFGTTEDYQFEIDGVAPIDYYRNRTYTSPSGVSTDVGAFSLFENWVEDGSFVKLRELSVSYAVPAEYVRGIGFDGLRATLYGRNLFSLDSYSGYDPETSVGGQSNTVRGYDFVQVPIPRTFGFTLSATL